MMNLGNLFSKARSSKEEEKQNRMKKEAIGASVDNSLPDISKSTKVSEEDDIPTRVMVSNIEERICPIVLMSTCEGKHGKDPDILGGNMTLLHDLPIQITTKINKKIMEKSKELLDPLSKSSLYSYSYRSEDIVIDQIYQRIAAETSMNFISAMQFSRLSILINQTALGSILYKFNLIFNSSFPGSFNRPEDDIKNFIRTVVVTKANNTRALSDMIQKNPSATESEQFTNICNERFYADAQISASYICDIIISRFADLIDKEINSIMAEDYGGRKTLIDTAINNFAVIAAYVASYSNNQTEVNLAVSIGLKELFRDFLYDFLVNVLSKSVTNSLNIIAYTNFELFDAYKIINGIQRYHNTDDDYRYYNPEDEF